MKYYIQFITILFSVGILSGCLSAVKVKPESTYTLSAVPHVIKKQTRPISILVTQPITEPVYSTTQMAYSLKPYQVAYYDKNRWAETPSDMLLPLIAKTLQNTHYFHAVIVPPAVISQYNYVLNTQILQLKQDYTQKPAVVRLTLRAQLVRVATNQVVATKEFTICAPMHQYTPYGGVIAANHATAEVLEELARFCVKNAR